MEGFCSRVCRRRPEIQDALLISSCVRSEFICCYSEQKETVFLQVFTKNGPSIPKSALLTTVGTIEQCVPLDSRVLNGG